MPKAPWRRPILIKFRPGIPEWWSNSIYISSTIAILSVTLASGN